MAVPKKGEGWVPKRSKSREGVREGLAWRLGGVQGFGCGGVGGRHWGTEAFFEGCPVTHRSWPGGRGGSQGRVRRKWVIIGGRGVREAGASVPGG